MENMGDKRGPHDKVGSFLCNYLIILLKGGIIDKKLFVD